jgi:thiaminase/transcriptional activator TenA
VNAPHDTVFSASAWEHTGRLLEAIHRHPFNVTLADGTLDPSIFGWYLVQDARYLAGFSRALAVASSRAPTSADGAFLAESAHRALVVESTLHTGYLEVFAGKGFLAAQIPTSPSCLAYVSYLQATAATDPWPVAVAALLPCFWVYADVGTTIRRESAPGPSHPFADWIATYADPGFAQTAATMRSLTDRAASSATPNVRAAMLGAFGRACEYEWLFWDSAWRRETWPTVGWLPDAPAAAQAPTTIPGTGP